MMPMTMASPSKTRSDRFSSVGTRETVARNCEFGQMLSWNGTHCGAWVCRTMRLSLRFVVPLFLALGIFAYAALPLVDKLMLRWFSRDLEVRANLIATTVDDPLHNLIRSGDRSRIQEFFTRLTQDERLFAVAF